MEALRYVYELLDVAVEVFLQKLRMRGLPPLGQIGGPAEGRVCVVTGPTSGIGRQAAMELAWRGAHVVLACRSRDRGEALARELRAAAQEAGQPEPRLEVMLLDLASLRSVREFAAAWEARRLPLHVLLNNAGLFALAGAREETEDGFEAHLGTNYLAHFLLTLLLLPSLRRGAEQSGRPSRVVNVSSKLHYVGSIHKQDPHLGGGAYKPLAAYSQSKLAQVLFAWELQRRTGGAVASVALHPGEVLTDVVRSLPGFMQRAYKLLLQIILLTPEQGARCSVHCATAAALEGPQAQGLYYYDSNCTPIAPSRQARDPALAAWLWEWSARAVGLSGEQALLDAAA